MSAVGSTIRAAASTAQTGGQAVTGIGRALALLVSIADGWIGSAGAHRCSTDAGNSAL